MSDNTMFERNVRAWLEIGPASAPKRVVDAALHTIESTPQQRDLRAPWRFPHLINTRLAVAAAVVLAVVGAGLLIWRSPQSIIGNPSPSPTTTSSLGAISLDAIHDFWASVGTRKQPILQGLGDESGFQTMTIDASGLRINGWKGDLTSAVSMTVEDGALSLRMDAAQDDLTREHWNCTTGDNGNYYASLSADGQTLTLTASGDECLTRDQMLTGDWTRWQCPPPYEYAYCDHVAELTPASYVASVFKPFNGSSGHLGYTVPSGWADLQKPPTWSSAEVPTSFRLTTFAAPGAPAITVYSTLRPYGAHAMPAGVNLSCGGGLDPSGTSGYVAGWLAGLPYLDVSQRVPVTIGGLSGVVVDLSVKDGYVDPCSSGQDGNGPVVYSKQIQIFGTAAAEEAIYMESGTGEHARFILLDAGDAQLVISLQAPSQDALDAVIAQAMPVIESFKFLPGTGDPQ